MKSLIAGVALLVAAFVAGSTAQNCIAADNCNFYQCLESKYKCGSAGYPVSYGTKFCEVFRQNQNKLDADGQRWSTGTRLCLQQALETVANSANKLSCDALRKYAFDSHPKCYTQPGNSICYIGAGQMYKVLNMVGVQWTAEYWRQFASVVAKCGSSWYSSLKQGLTSYIAQYF